MIEIERQFGPINLGHDEYEATQTLGKVVVKKPQFKGEGEDEEQDTQEQEKNPRSLLTLITHACLNETPKKFKNFLDLIDKATIEKFSIIQLQRKKILD